LELAAGALTMTMLQLLQMQFSSEQR